MGSDLLKLFDNKRPDTVLPVRRWAVQFMRTLALVRRSGLFVAGRCAEWRSVSDCIGSFQ